MLLRTEEEVMKAYQVSVAEYWPELDDKGCAEFQTWGSTYEESLIIFDEIVNNTPDDGDKWINDAEEFIYFWLLSTNRNIIKLPIMVTLEFRAQSYSTKFDEEAWRNYTKGRYKEFGVIKEQIVWPVKHYALQEAV